MREPARTFGRQVGGGRRRGDRSPAPLPVMISAVGLCRPAELVDISPVGARLRGEKLPGQAEDVELEVEGLVKFATIMWSKDHECGIRFAEPLRNFDLNRIRHSAKLGKFSRLTIEQRRVLEDWMIGIAR